MGAPPKSARFLLLAVGALVAPVAIAVSSTTGLRPGPDPAAVLGPNACAECHQAEAEVWQATPHHATGVDLPRRQEAQQIAERLGIRRIKADSDCLTCHFTVSLTDSGRERAVAGVSCESCHGAARDWLDVHADYGGHTRQTEPAEHRQARIAAATDAGMIAPENLYDLAAGCYACHTVQNERLVNVGGHNTGSKIELVAWSQGEMRHNFLRADGGANAVSSRERQRVMYLLGCALDLEYALRGVAGASGPGAYLDAHVMRARMALDSLRAANELVGSGDVDAMVAAAARAPLDPPDRAAIVAAADDVQRHSRALAGSDGAAFAGLDPLLPPPADYLGRPAKQ